MKITKLKFSRKKTQTLQLKP